MVAALTVVLFGAACGGSPNEEATGTSAPEGQDDSKQVTFTEADLDKLEVGLRKEIDAVKAAQEKAASASTAQERNEAIQAQWETATIPLGAEASGMSEPRYRDVRDRVDGVFTTLDFQGKIDGPLSIGLERADPETKARVSGDAFADVPPEAAVALRARMDRLVPLWSEYKKSWRWPADQRPRRWKAVEQGTRVQDGRFSGLRAPRHPTKRATRAFGWLQSETSLQPAVIAQRNLARTCR